MEIERMTSQTHYGSCTASKKKPLKAGDKSSREYYWLLLLDINTFHLGSHSHPDRDSNPAISKTLSTCE